MNLGTAQQPCKSESETDLLGKQSSSPVTSDKKRGRS